MSRLTLILLLLLGLGSIAAGRSPGNESSLLDSLSQVHPRLRYYWLRERGLDDIFGPSRGTTDSEGLVCAGRWSYGPAYDVDCRISAGDTLIALGRGSGVSLVRFSRTAPRQLELLADVNAERILNQVMIRDSLLLAGTNAGLELFDISDVHNPRRLSWIPTGCSGFDLKDSLAFVTWYDTFKVYNIANPSSPYRVGWCRDSGAAVSVAGNTAFLADRWGLYAVDVSNPANPHRVGSWGSAVVEAKARGNICCVTQFNPNQPEWLRLTVLDVANPTNMQPIGVLDSAGGYDMQYSRSLLFVSGYDQGVHEFEVISLADSTNPTRLGGLSTPGPNYGVSGDSLAGIAFVADGYEGMSTLDARNLSSPSLLGQSYAAALSVDISVDDSLAYVANEQAGLRILSVSDVARPRTLGELDSVYRGLNCLTAVGRDSFAYFGWFFEFTRVADVSDPGNPRMATQFNLFRNAEDMVLRDSFLYVAEDYRFQVVNVARPRSPTVVGTCNLPERSREVVLDDTLAYIADLGGVIVVNVARSSTPYVVATWPRATWGIDLCDSVLYALSYANANDDLLLSLSVANPAAPYVLDSVIVPRTMHDVVVVDSVAYCAGWQMVFVDVADPRNLTLLPGRWVQPSFYTRSLLYEPPFIYVAATDGGVCVLETLQTGLAEQPSSGLPTAVSIRPSVTTGLIRIETACAAGPCEVCVHDVAGKRVLSSRFSSVQEPGVLDLSQLPGGVYVVRIVTEQGSVAGRVVVTNRR